MFAAMPASTSEVSAHSFGFLVFSMLFCTIGYGVMQKETCAITSSKQSHLSLSVVPFSHLMI